MNKEVKIYSSKYHKTILNDEEFERALCYSGIRGHLEGLCICCIKDGYEPYYAIIEDSEDIIKISMIAIKKEHPSTKGYIEYDGKIFTYNFNETDMTYKVMIERKAFE